MKMNRGTGCMVGSLIGTLLIGVAEVVVSEVTNRQRDKDYYDYVNYQIETLNHNRSEIIDVDN